MCPHNHVNFAALELADNCFLLLRRAKTRKQLHTDGKAFHPAGNGLVVLPCKDRRGNHHSALLSVRHALERGAQGNFRFSEADVAAQQPIHRDTALHIRFDLVDTAELIVGFIKLEVRLKIALPLVIRRKSVPFCLHPLGVKADKVLGDILNGAAHLCLGLLPVVSAQPAQADGRVLPRADIFRNHVELRNGDIERIALCIADFDVILRNALHAELPDSLKNADTVRGVDNVIPGRQIGDIGDRLPFADFGRLSAAGRRNVSARNQPEKSRGILKTAGKRPGRYSHLAAGDFFRLLHIGGVDSLRLKIRSDGFRRAPAACKHGAGPFIFEHCMQIFG